MSLRITAQLHEMFGEGPGAAPCCPHAGLSRALPWYAGGVFCLLPSAVLAPPVGLGFFLLSPHGFFHSSPMLCSLTTMLGNLNSFSAHKKGVLSRSVTVE